MGVDILRRKFMYNVYEVNSERHVLSRELYLNDLKKIFDEQEIEFTEMTKTNGDTWKVYVKLPQHWK